MGKRMNQSDKARLTAALDELPGHIAYLRQPILAIAKQDPDLLGSGEADPTAVERALRKRAKAAENVSTAASDAEELDKWLRSMPDHQDAWAAPAWFVQGFLHGCDWFGFDDGEPAPPLPVAAGLEQITIDVPEGMKTKLYVRGLEIRNREVQIIIGEETDDIFEKRSGGAANTYQNPPPSMGPKLEPPSKFESGLLSGIRMIMRHEESQLPVMALYFLTMKAVKLEISIFSKARRGADLTKYESLLATIKLR